MTLADQKFHVSRDVIFHEDTFPFAQHQNSSLPLPILIPHFFHESPPTHTTDIPTCESTETTTHALPTSGTTRPQRPRKTPSYL